MQTQKFVRELGLQIAEFEPGLATLVQETEEKDVPDLFDYSPDKQEFSLLRFVPYKTLYSRRYVRDLLRRNQGACIYNTLTHHPPEGLPANKVLLRGEPFVDRFGLYVYIFSTLSWVPRNDVDLRFNKGLYPYDIIESELGFLFT